MIHTFICPTAGNCNSLTCSHKEEHEESDECVLIDQMRNCPACTRYTGIIPMNIWETLRHNINQIIGDDLGENTFTIPIIYRSIILDFYNACHHKTIDTYLGYLRKAGYLYIIGRGEYQKVVDIPHMSLTELKNEAYGQRVVFGVDRASLQSIVASAGHYYTNSNIWSINRNTHEPVEPETIPDFLSEEDMQIE